MKRYSLAWYGLCEYLLRVRLYVDGSAWGAFYIRYRMRKPGCRLTSQGEPCWFVGPFEIVRSKPL